MNINKPTEMVDWLLDEKKNAWIENNHGDNWDWDSAYVVKYLDSATGEVESFPVCGIVDIIPLFAEYFAHVAQRIVHWAREYNLPKELVYKDDINDIDIVVEKDSPLYWYTARKEILDEKFQEFCEKYKFNFDICSLCSSEWMSQVELWKICKEVH